MRTIEGRRTGIRWQFANKLEDLELADDVALVASRILDMQTKVEKQVMKWNVNPGIKIQQEGRGRGREV